MIDGVELNSLVECWWWGLSWSYLYYILKAGAGAGYLLCIFLIEVSAKLKMIINAKCILALAQLFPRNEFEESTFIWEIKDHPIDLDIQLN